MLNSIREYCSKNSLKVASEDKSTGIVIAEDYRASFFTFENPDGTPQVTNAHIVLGCEKPEGKYKCLTPELVKSDINFKVRENNGKTAVSISLTNIKASWGLNNKTGQPYYFRDVKSTGVFEKEIAGFLK
ncbi:hypothetical protein [Emticicia sp. C21]|uniref:hypothetical protein n=1 Tax=Emticicia sp. C21 TaxID=2302915 RepID=UPI000E3473AC|nr:hypothetical protein [Emticicia sp. C21]RFS17021.1 hypothetical protein D0T08_10105 [Emticicia sp. C21]